MGKVLDAARELEERNANATIAEHTPGPPSETEGRISELHSKRNELLALMEETILARANIINQSNTTWAPRLFFSQAELSIVDELGWDKNTLRQEIARVLTVANWQAKAGTANDREKSQQQLIDAEAAYDARAGEIAQEIGRLQRELRLLERQRTDARAEVEQRSQALTELRKLAPPAAALQHVRRMSALNPLRIELTEKQNRLANIRQIGAMDLNDLDHRRRAYEIVHSWGRDDLQRSATNDYIDAQGWGRFAAGLQKEIPDLESRIEAIKAQIEVEAADANTLLDTYVR